MTVLHPALSAFHPLPWPERLFVRGRLASAPLEALTRRVRGPRVLDVGCGHGLVCALLAHGHPERVVTGIDPDARKVAWARASVGRWPGTRFLVTTVQALAPDEPGAWDTITVADVLYLLPPGDHPGFLAACHALLAPAGQLVLKEAEDDGGWRTWKALAQERLMVRLLGRTRSSGGLGFSKREVLVGAVQGAGFRVDEVVSLKQGSTTPHLLVVATRR